MKKYSLRQRILFLSGAILFCVILVAIMSVYLPVAVDWHGAFRPATLEMLHGHSPYAIGGFYHAPWGLIPLIPLAILPEPIGRAILVVVSITSFAFVAHQLGAKPVAVGFLIFSPPVVHLVLNGNMDWMAAIGFILPPQWGLFFISVKPQMGIAVAPFWLIQSWQKGGWKLVIKIFAPFTLALLLSFVLYGIWPLASMRATQLWWNASLWPLSIPVGLSLFVASVRKRKIEYAIAASPCLSPYVLLHSWVGVFLAICSLLPELIVAVVGLWVVVIYRLIG